MSFLALRAYWKLIYFDLYLARGDFAALYQKVRNYPVRKPHDPVNTTEKICAAVAIACIWYWKEVLCLQRSATSICLLRFYGVPAQLIIGAQQIPFRAHAWVEVDGRVVNDKISKVERYAVLDQC
jgi:hypothetical protein